jgi:hypothetical protein
LIFAISFKGSYPKMEDWISLAFILIAIAFISKAEKKRVAYIKREESLELKAAHA